MSRIGKLPVAFPANVKVSRQGVTVNVEGPKGKMNFTHHPDIQIEVDDAKRQVLVKRPSDEKRHKALHGLTRSLIANMVRGVTDPFEKKLEITGVGYQAVVKGRQLSLSVGFSHEVVLDIPDGVTVVCPRPQEIVITGVDKQKVGDLAARARKVRPPEPYNGKGIKYAKSKDQDEEIIKRKAGKAFGSGEK